MAILQMTVNAHKLNDKQMFKGLSPYNDIEGDWIVDWGDGTIEVNSEVHQYRKNGVYQITIKGNFKTNTLWCPVNIISLDREEDCGITNLERCFYGCIQLKSVPHSWDISKVRYTTHMFWGCIGFNQDLSHWDLSNIKSKGHMFKDCPLEDRHKPKTK